MRSITLNLQAFQWEGAHTIGTRKRFRKWNFHFIAKVAYEEQHLERVDRMELIENQMWINYWKEPDRFKKVKILVEIVNIQPYISSYYEATKNLVEGQNFKLKYDFPLNPPKGMNKITMEDEDGELYWTKPEVELWFPIETYFSFSMPLWTPYRKQARRLFMKKFL